MTTHADREGNGKGDAIHKYRGLLLLHQFLAKIPEDIARQLKASGEITTFNKVMTHSKLLMTIEPLAAIADKKPSLLAEQPQLLREQIAPLTQQIIALITSHPEVYSPRCFKFDIFSLITDINNVTSVAS